MCGDGEAWNYIESLLKFGQRRNCCWAISVKYNDIVTDYDANFVVRVFVPVSMNFLGGEPVKPCIPFNG